MAKEIIIDINVRDAQKNLQEINETLLIQKEIISDLEVANTKLEGKLEKTSKKDLNRRRDISKEITKNKQLIKEEKAGIEANTLARDKANVALKTAKDNTADLGGAMNILDSQTGGLASSLTSFSSGGLKKTIKGFLTLKTLAMASVFGLIIGAIAALKAAFTSSEDGQNKFLSIMSQIGVVVGNVTDIVADLGMGIFNTGKALVKLATGDFAGATAAFAEMTVNVKSATNSIVNFGEETRKEIKLAKELSEQRAKADKAERKLIVERAEANRKVAELRERAADKENVTVQERIEAIKEAGKIEEEITAKEIEAARLRFEAKKTENSLSKSTKEDLDEEAQLRATLIDLETARLRKQKALTAEITTALREEESERNRIVSERKAKEAEDKKLKEEQDKEAAKKKAEQDKLDKEAADKLAAETLERDERVASSEIEIEQRRLNAKKAATDGIISLFGAESGAGRAAAALRGVLAAQEMIAEAKKSITFSSLAAANSATAVAEGTAQTAKIGFPQNIPMLIAYAIQAAGIISSISGAVSKSNSIASSLGGGGGAATPSFQAPPAVSVPPAFNVVGASATNQLAGAIGSQSQTPIKAFVVANDVTTAQSLERNIIQGATIG